MENKGYAKFLGANKLHYNVWEICKWQIVFAWVVYSYFEKGFGKNVHATIPKGIGMLSNLLLLLSFSTRRYMSTASSAILSNFFEKK